MLKTFYVFCKAKTEHQTFNNHPKQNIKASCLKNQVLVVRNARGEKSA